VSDRDARFEAALRNLRADGVVTVPHLIAGKAHHEGELIDRRDPSSPDLVVSRCHEAPGGLVAAAVQAARGAADTWAALTSRERADRLRPALELLTSERRLRMAAVIAMETGKSRAECFAEVDELAVLLDRYCRVGSDDAAWEEQLDQAGTAAVTRSLLRPYGVFAVISPFNYPMVLGAGPAIAALVAGNTVVWKPSHLGPRSAQLFADLVAELELPPGVFGVIHGADEAGRYLTADMIDGVAFTGSVPTGLAIRQVLSAGDYPRPMIAELGGKNPVIVTDSADLDVAAHGIVTAAFGMSGQRCSACSRVIATTGVYEDVVARLAELTATVSIDDPVERSMFAGPLIDGTAMHRFEDAVSAAAKDGEVVVGGGHARPGGQFAAPTVVAGLAQGHDLTRRELFVPLITVTAVADFDAALGESNATPFGLTAGIYTGSPDEASAFLRGAEAGCLNVNNPKGATTGWWPGNQTFGGWKASGLGGKQAFGTWYVQQFAREQCRTVAAGFAR
jgi:1-pyrroline-5-carboxylate dehydrogenase